jgi:hypothetical protein
VSLSPLSGSAENESAPRSVRDTPDIDGLARLRNLDAYTKAGTPRSIGDGDNGQEEILDLIVAATLAQDDPLDDEPADADYWDPDELRGLRRDDVGAPCAPPDGTGSACPPATGDDPAGASAKGAQSPGWGFASDGPLDELIPGPVLAGLADTAHGSGLRLVNDDELTGIIRAWRRLTSWVTARELAAIAELARRRPADERTTPGLRLKARLLAASSAERDSTRRNEAGAHAGAAPESAAPESEGPAGTVPVDGEPNEPGRKPNEPGREPLRSAGTGRSASEGSGPDAGFPEFIDPFASDELAAALTLTVRAAEAHLEFATDLATKLPKTAAALEAGVIDPIRARIIADATRVLTDEHAALVEEMILPGAGQQTSGQLRAALARAILAADPEAARRRREEAQRDARVMRWREDSGTAALCGRDLPSIDVLAADQRISARARELKAAGVEGTMDQLRARAYLDFLLGRSTVPDNGADDCQPASPSPRSESTPADRGAAPGHADGSAAGSETTAGLPNGPAARINVTVPLSAILGLSDLPAEVAAFGPVDAQLGRYLVRAAGIHPATRWCVTVVGEDGRAVGHGCARGRHTAPAPPFPGNSDGPGPPDDSRKTRTGPRESTPGSGPRDPSLAISAKEFMERLGIRVTPLAVGMCDHRNEEPGYKPSRRLRHLVGARTASCTAPGCRRAAAQCDFDHTVAYDVGGRTCECDLSPLCRRHHRCKQARGWALVQQSPGEMTWTTPSGRRYTTMPTGYYV